MPDRATIGRTSLVMRLVALASSGGTAVVVAAPGGGLSTVLRDVVTESRRAGRTTSYHRFPDERFTGVEAHPDTIAVVDDAHRGHALQTLALRDRALEGGTVVGVRFGAAPDALSWLWRSGLAERVDLEPLDPISIGSLIEQRVGGPVHGSLVAGVVARSAGRPGFVVDEVESMRSSEAAPDAPGFLRDHLRGTNRLPLIERAQGLLDELPSHTARAVRTVAMAGALPPGALDRLGIDAHDLIARRLVDPVDAREHSPMRLVPPALASAVRATLSPSSAAESAGAILELAPEHLSPEDRARVHLALGLPLDLDEISAAAWAAVSDRALAGAVTLAHRAADHGPSGTMVAAEILTNVGEREEAAQYYTDLLLDEEVDGFVKARAATEYSSLLLWDLGRPEEAVQIAAELTASVGDGPFAVPALLHHASLLTYSGQPAAAIDLLCDVESDGRDPQWQRLLCLVRVVASSFVEPRTPTRDQIDSLTLISDERLAETFGPAVGVIAVELAYEMCGHYADAADVVNRARQDARLHATPLSAAWLGLAEARSELGTGRAALARRVALEATTSFADINHPSGRRWALGAALLASSLTGDGDACRVLAAQLGAASPGAPFLDADLLRAQAWGAWTTGDSSATARLLAEAAGFAVEVGSPTLEAVVLHDSYRLLGSPVARRLTELRRACPVPAIELRSRHVDLVTAELPEELLRLADSLEAYGALLLSAEVANDAARIAAAQGRRSTARQAAAHRTRLAGLCGNPVSPGLSDQRSRSLTNRERDIAIRAAGGHPSKAIADDLGLSVRTVDNVLQRIYIKLGIHSRAELSLDQVSALADR